MTPLFARQQDPDRAFERLYKAHVQDVYRYALMVLRNREDAEDVVQTTFLKAYRVFARGERPRNARPWLITIAHNTCRTRLRDAMRRPQEVAFEDRLADSFEAQSHDGVEPQELLRALGALSFNQRAALVMRELEGRTYAEIAHVLEVTPSAVETLLYRARRAVREQIEGALTCGDAEHALSLDLDGRLSRQEKAHLRAHLRTCGECASLARRQRARRAALRGLGPIPLPGSLASFGGGTAAGTGIAAKVAAVVAASAAAVGVAGFEAADAVPEAVPHAGDVVAGAVQGAPGYVGFAATSGPATAKAEHALPVFVPGQSVPVAELGTAGALGWVPTSTAGLTPSTAAAAAAAGGVEASAVLDSVVTTAGQTVPLPVSAPTPTPTVPTVPVAAPSTPSVPIAVPSTPTVPIAVPSTPSVSDPVPALPSVPIAVPTPPPLEPPTASIQTPELPQLPVAPTDVPSLPPPPTLPLPDLPGVLP